MISKNEYTILSNLKSGIQISYAKYSKEIDALIRDKYIEPIHELVPIDNQCFETKTIGYEITLAGTRIFEEYEALKNEQEREVNAVKLAQEANTLSEKSNQLSEEANEISKKANKKSTHANVIGWVAIGISVLSIIADIIIAIHIS